VVIVDVDDVDVAVVVDGDVSGDVDDTRRRPAKGSADTEPRGKR
jgi:hypothetical protein